MVKGGTTLDPRHAEKGVVLVLPPPSSRRVHHGNPMEDRPQPLVLRRASLHLLNAEEELMGRGWVSPFEPDTSPTTIMLLWTCPGDGEASFSLSPPIDHAPAH